MKVNNYNKSKKHQNSTKLAIAYTPCYMQCGNIPRNLIEELNLFVLFLWVGKLKFEYLYIKKTIYYYGTKKIYSNYYT